MATATKLSITLPTAVLAAAEQVLARPGETRSAMLARVLAAALERELEHVYAEGYRRQPVTPAEDAIMQEAARQGFAQAATDQDRAAR